MADHCHGNGPDHCCYFKGTVCPYLEENTVPGRRWACGLVRELGGFPIWQDERWQRDVKPLAQAAGLPVRYLCANWPQDWELKQCCFADNSPCEGGC